MQNPQKINSLAEWNARYSKPKLSNDNRAAATQSSILVTSFADLSTLDPEYAQHPGMVMHARLDLLSTIEAMESAQTPEGVIGVTFGVTPTEMERAFYSRCLQ